MGGRTLLIGVVLLGAAWSYPIPTYDSRLSSLELAIIKCIVETVPGVTKGGGGTYDWSVVQSRSKELQGAEIEVVQVGQRDPDFTARSGGGYPSDWNIVRSVSSQLGARDDGNFQEHGRAGLSDDWAIMKSISTELHLDVEQGPGDASNEPAYQPPTGQEGRGRSEGNNAVVFPNNQPISSVEGNSGDYSIDIRSFSSDLPSANGMEIQQSYSQSEEYMGIGGTGENDQRSFGNGGTSQEVTGVQNNEGGAIGWSIVRSISSEQEPISEDMSSSGSQQAISTSGTQAEKGDTDSYNVVQPISTELQPADNEAGEIPASLTEIFPPPLEQPEDSWNSQPSEGAQPSEIDSSETDHSSTVEGQEPCETGHKRIKNVCRKVYSFQLKSHLK